MRPARDYELPEYPTCNYMFPYLETRSRDICFLRYFADINLLYL